MKLNPDKFQCIVFGNVVNPGTFIINGNIVRPEQKVKLLGVHIDKNWILVTIVIYMPENWQTS